MIHTDCSSINYIVHINETGCIIAHINLLIITFAEDPHYITE